MCIIIDTNCLSHVFIEDDSEHTEFKPVLDWIINGNGKIVYGGKTYEQELKVAAKFRKLFTEFARRNKVIVIDKECVDTEEANLLKLKKHRDFDDPHIVAIVIVSGVRIICTKDKRSFPFIQNKTFYIKCRVPKVYSNYKCAKLLCDKNIPKKYLSK